MLSKSSHTAPPLFKDKPENALDLFKISVDAQPFVNYAHLHDLKTQYWLLVIRCDKNCCIQSVSSIGGALAVVCPVVDAEFICSVHIMDSVQNLR